MIGIAVIKNEVAVANCRRVHNVLPENQQPVNRFRKLLQQQKLTWTETEIPFSQVDDFLDTHRYRPPIGSPYGMGYSRGQMFSYGAEYCGVKETERKHTKEKEEFEAKAPTMKNKRLKASTARRLANEATDLEQRRLSLGQMCTVFHYTDEESMG